MLLVLCLLLLRSLLFLVPDYMGAIPSGGVVLLLPESARLLFSSFLRSVDYKSGG